MSRNGHRFDEIVFDQNEARNIGGVLAAEPTLQVRKGDVTLAFSPVCCNFSLPSSSFSFARSVVSPYY